MKHIRKFESHRNKRRRDDVIKESVLQVNDLYKVRSLIDIPQSLINAYVKKVKDTTGKNLRQFFGDVDIAEEIVKYINTNFLNVDQVPAGALTGDAQSQGQAGVEGQPGMGMETPIQPQAQAPVQGQAQAPAPQAQTQPQVQVQAEAQPTPAQGQMAPQAQGQPGSAPQGQAAPQSQAQAGPSGEFEEVGEDEDDEEKKRKEEEEGNEELPL